MNFLNNSKLLLLGLLVLFVSSIAVGQPTGTDGFESGAYDDGDPVTWDESHGFTSDTSDRFAIVQSPTANGGYAFEINNGDGSSEGMVGYDRGADHSLSDGDKIQAWMRSTTGDGENNLYYYPAKLEGGGTPAGIEVAMRGGGNNGWRLRTNGGTDDGWGSYSADTWYRVVTEFTDISNKQVQVTVYDSDGNQHAQSDVVTFSENPSDLTWTGMRIYTNTESTGYFDDVSYEPVQSFDSDPNSAPSVSNRDPADDATGVNDTTDGSGVDVDLSFDLADSDGDSLDVEILDGNNNVINSWSGVNNDSSLSYTWQDLNEGTSYDWKVNVSDGTDNTLTSEYTFTTDSSSTSSDSPMNFEGFEDGALTDGNPVDWTITREDVSDQFEVLSDSNIPVLNGTYALKLDNGGGGAEANAAFTRPNHSIEDGDKMQTWMRSTTGDSENNHYFFPFLNGDGGEKLEVAMRGGGNNGWRIRTNNGGTDDGWGSYSADTWYRVVVEITDASNQLAQARVYNKDGSLKAESSEISFGGDIADMDETRVRIYTNTESTVYYDSMTTEAFQTYDPTGSKTESITLDNFVPADGASDVSTSKQLSVDYSNSESNSGDVIFSWSNGTEIYSEDSVSSGSTVSTSELDLAENSNYEYNVEASTENVTELSNNISFSTTIDLNDYIIADKIGSGTDGNFADGRDVIVDDGYAFIGGMYSTDALIIMDVKDKSNPTYVDEVSTDLTAGRGVAKKGDIVYVSGRDSGSVISVNVSDPENPEYLDTVSSSNMEGARGISIRGNQAYVAVGYYGSSSHTNEAFVSIDISDPNNMNIDEILTGSNIDRGGNTRPHPDQDIVYMSNYRGNSLQVFNVSDPANPSYITKVDSPDVNDGRDLAIRPDGDRIYMSNAGGGVIGYDTTTADSPQILNYFSDDDLGGARGNHYYNGHVYVSGRGANTMTVVNVQDDDNYQKRDSINDNTVLDGAYGLHVDKEKELVYTASDSGYLGIFGNESGLDTTAPSISIDSPVDGQTYNSDSVVLNVTSDEAVDTWEYSLDGGSNQAFTPNTTLTDLSDGSHTLDVDATDSSFNTGSESVSFTVDAADDTPPSTSDDWTESGFVDKSDVTVELTASDDDSGVSNISYRVNGADYTTDSGSSTTVSISEQGNNTLEYYATDSAGNQESVNTEYVALDAGPGVVEIGEGTVIEQSSNDVEINATSSFNVSSLDVYDSTTGFGGSNFTVSGDSSDPITVRMDDYNASLPVDETITDFAAKTADGNNVTFEFSGLQDTAVYSFEQAGSLVGQEKFSTGGSVSYVYRGLSGAFEEFDLVRTDNFRPEFSSVEFVDDQVNGVERFDFGLDSRGESDISGNKGPGTVTEFSNSTLGVEISPPVQDIFTVNDSKGAEVSRDIDFNKTDSGVRESDFSHDFTAQRVNQTTQYDNNGVDPVDYTLNHSLPGTVQSGGDFTGSVAAGGSVSETSVAEGDFLSETEYGFEPTPTNNEVVLGIDYQGKRDLEVQNNEGVSFSDVDTSGAVSTPSVCTQSNASTVDVPASADRNYSVEFSCDPGSIGNPTEDIDNVSDSEERVWYNTTDMNISSNLSENTQYALRFNKDGLKNPDGRDGGSLEANVEGQNSEGNDQLNVTDTGSYFRVTVGAEFQDSSLHTDDTDAGVTYTLSDDATEAPSGGGGGGGSSGTDTTTVYFESEDSVEEEYSAPFGTSVDEQLSITNTERRVLTVEVSKGSERICDYITVQKSFTSDEFGDSGTFQLDEATESFGSVENTNSTQLRFQLPQQELIEEKGIEDFKCSFETSSSYGEAEDFVVDVNPSDSFLAQLSEWLKSTLFEVPLDNLNSIEDDEPSDTVEVKVWESIVGVALLAGVAVGLRRM